MPAPVGQAVGVIERLSEADAFLAVNDAFLELAPLGERPIQKDADRHARTCGLAKPFPTRKTFEQLQDMQEKTLTSPIVPGPDAGQSDIEIPRHLERNITKRLGNSLGVLAERTRLPRMTSHLEVVAQIDGQLPESRLIPEGPGQALSFAETVEDLLEFAERKECSSEVEAKIDAALQPLAGFGQMLEGRQRLLEAAYRLPVG